MNINLKSLAILLVLTFSVSMVRAETEKKTEKIEIEVNTEGDNVTKKVTVNGKQLSPEEIKQFEASGKMKTIHMGGDNPNGKKYKIIMSDDDAHDIDDKEVEVTVDADGSEKIIINGKELSTTEIDEMKSSGKMKILHLDLDSIAADDKSHRVIFIDADDDSADHIKLIKAKMLDHDNSGKNIQKIWINTDGKNGEKIKIISKEFLSNVDDGASLGFMVNVKQDGWHIIKSIAGSGAQDAGIQKGDVLTKIANVDLTSTTDQELASLQELPTFKVDEMVPVQLHRNGKDIQLQVQARKLDLKKSTKTVTASSDNDFQWHNIDGLDPKDIKVMVFNGDDDDFRLNEEDINMVFPKDLGGMNIFISDGKSTSKLLGKHHEMSSLSGELESYFHTKGGVLVLHVDDNNVFGLKDGDVIKSVAGVKVKSPKDVIKQLLLAEDQENLSLRIVRHKRNKTLKYHVN